MLVPLTDPSEFTGEPGPAHRSPLAPRVCSRAHFRPPDSRRAAAGGGTGFWSQDSRGHRVEAPTAVLRPPAGTAMLFGGHVSHAGMPVKTGERAVFVASFSLRGGAAAREEAAAQSRDIYGDLL